MLPHFTPGECQSAKKDFSHRSMIDPRRLKRHSSKQGVFFERGLLTWCLREAKRKEATYVGAGISHVKNPSGAMT